MITYKPAKIVKFDAMRTPTKEIVTKKNLGVLTRYPLYLFLLSCAVVEGQKKDVATIVNAENSAGLSKKRSPAWTKLLAIGSLHFITPVTVLYQRFGQTTLGISNKICLSVYCFGFKKFIIQFIPYLSRNSPK